MGQTMEELYLLFHMPGPLSQNLKITRSNDSRTVLGGNAGAIPESLLGALPSANGAGGGLYGTGRWEEVTMEAEKKTGTKVGAMYVYASAQIIALESFSICDIHFTPEPFTSLPSQSLPSRILETCSSHPLRWCSKCLYIAPELGCTRTALGTRISLTEEQD